jgi:hypothetical protein
MSVAVGVFCGIVPNLAILSAFIGSPGSRFSMLLFSALYGIGLPGYFFASIVLRQPHGASLSGMLLLGSPFNAVFYASLCYGFIKASRF